MADTEIDTYKAVNIDGRRVTIPPSDDTGEIIEELVKALEGCLKQLELEQNHRGGAVVRRTLPIRQARAALAKARGEEETNG